MRAKAAAALATIDPARRARVIAALDGPACHALHGAFEEWAHDGQTAPRGDWRCWVMMAGRGFGKTRGGAEWVLGLVREKAPESHHQPHPNPSPEGEGLKGLRIALVGATIAEARAIMVEGASGLLACALPGEIADWCPSRRTLRFANGAEAVLFSGASPEALRGPEHHYAWCDELAKWRRGKDAWDNLQIGLRAGTHPRVLVTTTPRAGTVLNAILAAPDTVITGGPTWRNPHLPAAFVAAMRASYAGTRAEGPELEGVMPGDVEGSLWPMGLREGSRGHPIGESLSPLAALRQAQAESPSPGTGEGEVVRVVIGVDPPASASGTCGISVCGLGADGRGYVLADASVSGASPEGWARAVAAAARDWGADRVIVEANQGGDMVKSVLRAAEANLPIRAVHATRGKAARAEPVAALFESGRAKFAGVFPALEAELAGLTTGGDYQGPGTSPDRADAMVWAMTALMLIPGAVPRMRRV